MKIHKNEKSKKNNEKTMQIDKNQLKSKKINTNQREIKQRPCLCAQNTNVCIRSHLGSTHSILDHKLGCGFWCD